MERIKVRLGDYIALSRVERSYFLVEALEHELASPLKKGVGRFQSLTEVIGLHSSLAEEPRKALFELQQIRNNVAHRSGKCDRKLIADCPWLDLELDEQVPISGAMLQSYFNASAELLLQLLYSAGDVYGMELRPQAEAVKAPPPYDA